MEYHFVKEQARYYWTSYPFLDFPKKSIMVCLVLIFVAYLLWEIAVVAWEQPFYYLLGIIVLMISLTPYFVPTSYFFFDTGFIVQYPIIRVEKLYSDYLCFYLDHSGIMLSTFTKPRRMDSFRGQSIRFSKTAAEKEMIINFLQAKIGKKY